MKTEIYATAGMGGVPAPHVERERVRKATRDDVPRLARAMARAFYDDPVVGHWFFEEASRRIPRLERGFEVFLRLVYLPGEECYTTEGLGGGALWLPPGKWRMSVIGQLRLLPRLAWSIGLGRLPRLLGTLGFMESKHPHEPHYYLPLIGVEPASQGRGIGSALMRPILERCDREGVPAYLEATAPSNRALYLRHGFEVVGELEIPKGGPPIWPMWRKPAGGRR
jgi:ribosomal protein S18 acetylase RimI-like enzyme